MKIAHLVESLHRGGRTSVIEQLIAHLRGPEFTHELWCLSQAGDGADLFEKRQVPIRILGRKGFDLKMPLALRKLIKANGVSLLHAHGIDAMFYGSLAARFSGVPSVGTVHIIRATEDQDRSTRLRNQLTVKLTDRIVPVSSGTMAALETATGAKPQKMRLIENGIDWERIDSFPPLPMNELEALFGGPIEGCLLGMVAMMSAHKDFETLLTAFREVVNQEPKTRLLIVGQGPKQEAIVKQIQQLDLGGSVKLLGFRQDVPAILRRLDFFVLSTFAEGFSLAAAEAMGCGCVPVVSDVDGVHGVVTHNETGLLVPRKDPRALAEALLSMIRDGNRRKQMAARGSEFVRKQFSQQRMLKAYAELYAELTHNRS